MSKNATRESSPSPATPDAGQGTSDAGPLTQDEPTPIPRARIAQAVREPLELSDKAAALLLAYVETRDGVPPTPEVLLEEGRTLRHQHPTAWFQLRNCNPMGFGIALARSGLPAVSGPELQAAMANVFAPPAPPAPAPKA